MLGHSRDQDGTAPHGAGVPADGAKQHGSIQMEATAMGISRAHSIPHTAHSTQAGQGGLRFEIVKFTLSSENG